MKKMINQSRATVCHVDNSMEKRCKSNCIRAAVHGLRLAFVVVCLCDQVRAGANERGAGASLRLEPPVGQIENKMDIAATREKELIAALVHVQSGNIKELSKSLAVDPTIATRRSTRTNETALHWAARYDQADIAVILMKHGADTTVMDRILRATPVHVAARSDSLSVLKAMVDRGVDINCRAEGPLETDRAPLITPYASPLDVAAEFGAEHTVEFLVKRGAKMDINPLETSFSALHRAMTGRYASLGLGNPKRLFDATTRASVGNRIVIDLLMAHKADIFSKDYKGNTPFHTGVYYRSLDSIDYMLNTHPDSVDVNSPGQFDQIPLQIAVDQTRLVGDGQVKEVIRFLIAHGADVSRVGGPRPRITAFDHAKHLKFDESVLEMLRPR